MSNQEHKAFIEKRIESWINDWCLFAREAMEIELDAEQESILRAVQNGKRISVASGTARGKDFIAAVAAICFLYLTPAETKNGQPESTKVALTAPTERQCKNIMMPEIARIYYKLKANGIAPNGARLTSFDIRTNSEDWFLTAFKADEHTHEAWSGFHAVNTMFVITEASGISETVFNAIEGNLQGNSRILLVFNNNTGTGYAANTQKSARWERFRLDSLSAPNVQQKKIVIPGQVDYEWVKDKVQAWCVRLTAGELPDDIEGDFEFEGEWYRPNDLFRVKVRGLAPKVSSDVLVPVEWIELANKRWKAFAEQKFEITKPLRLGVDIAGMGRDNSCLVYRFGDFVKGFDMIQSGGAANHMQVAGRVKTILEQNSNSFHGRLAQAFIDTIGEGAGVYSRLVEQNVQRVYSCKFSEAAVNVSGVSLKDYTGQYEFVNMRAYLYWAIRDWLNPANKSEAMLPADVELLQELTETKWEFQSSGKIKIESKDDIKKRLKRSPDKADALANTFWPIADIDVAANAKRKNVGRYFF